MNTDQSTVAEQPPSSNSAVNTNTNTNSTTSEATLTSLHNYPFTTDTAFLAGLTQIFGHPGTPVTEAELSQNPDLVLSAKCFYFSRKFQTATPVDPAEYKAWLASPEAQSQPQPGIEPAHLSAAEPPPPPPPYPTSFAAIVELITNNKPIPGIEEIPNTVLELGSSKRDKVVRRRKPWETTDHNDADDADDDDPVSKTTSKKEEEEEKKNEDGKDRESEQEGLLRLLRPDAVADGGLVAQD